MDALRIPLSAIEEDGLMVRETVPGGALGGEGAKDLRPGGVTIEGTLTPAAGGYVFQGRLMGTFTRACDRCLNEVELPFEEAVTWVFEHGEELGPFDFDGDDDEGDDIRRFQGNEIDLAPAVWEEVVLAYPPKFVCADRPDLCPQCGMTEETYISGAEDVRDGEKTGLAGLADMFPDLKPDDLEE